MSPARAPGGGVSHERARRVLIAGAGVAALEGVLALRHLAGARVSLDVLAPTPDFVLRPFSVLEPFGEARVSRLSLGGVLRELGTGHVFDGLAAVEPARHSVRAVSGDEYGYDALIVSTAPVRSMRCPERSPSRAQAPRCAFASCWGSLSVGRCASSCSRCQTAPAGRCRCTSWRC